ncbi:MAG: phosphoribosylglycinamide formyltransferase [Oscillospiraceae bacterium]|jgi:phosphoribosylglycinamide formyltransferase-1|nr:phosphoribosylglycinamide formyltransferase [Oscillospiraceae bacterium]
MVNIAVLVSGGGSNLQALIDNPAAYPDGALRFVLSSRKDAPALRRAAAAGIESAVISPEDYSDRDEYTLAIVRALQSRDTDLAVFAGFLYILSSSFFNVYAHRAVNVHPSLIPSFCGKGYYGIKVHEAALAYGVKVTGATVHIVTEGADEGPILLQKAIDILPGDTAESLRQRVMLQCEHILLPRAVGLMCERLARSPRL